MATIVQDYGPIYGEVVNGTVQGRPNGSVYIPISNTIVLTGPDNMTLAFLDPAHPTRLFISDTVYYVARSQDLASNVRLAVYSDSECTTMFGTPFAISAGIFNGSSNRVGFSTDAITTGDTYYLRAELMNNNVAVAISDVIEVTGDAGE